MTRKDFRRAVSVTHLKVWIGRKVLNGHPYSLPSTSKIDVDDVCYDRIDHNIGKKNVQRCCQFDGC